MGGAYPGGLSSFSDFFFFYSNYWEGALASPGFTAYTHVLVGEQRNNTKAFGRLPASSKTRLPKQDHLELSVCPS